MVANAARRIVCVGNALIPQDAAGWRTYDVLTRRPVPAGIDIVDGGLAGLNLLWCFDGADRVVFVDAVLDAPHGADVEVVGPADVRDADADAFGHAAGLGYLLRAHDALAGAAAPEVFVVAVPSTADQATIERAAGVSLALACGEAT